MKNFFIILILGFVFSASSAFASVAPTAPNPIVPPIERVSPRAPEQMPPENIIIEEAEPEYRKRTCQDIRKKMMKSPDDIKRIFESAEKEDFSNVVSVYLSEAFEPTYGMSCSEIVYCLRSMPIEVPVEDDKNATRALSRGEKEPLVIASLRGDKILRQCLVEGRDGLNLLTNYASKIYQWIASLVGAVCVLIIIISGIQIIIGGLTQEEVTAAKDRIQRSLVGLVVLFLSAFILYTINPIFFT